MMIDHTNPNPLCANCGGTGAWNNTPDPCGCCWDYGTQRVPEPDRDAEVLDRGRLVEMAVGLWGALEMRQECLACDGDGEILMEMSDGTRSLVMCDCVIEANEALARNQDNWNLLVNEYLWLHGYDPEVVSKEARVFVERILEKLRTD